MQDQKQNQLDNLKKRVFGKEKEFNLLDGYHFLMIHYGYIPFEEYKKMDVYIKDELIKRINETNEKGHATSRMGGKL